MKTQHTFKPMEFAQWFDKHDVHQAVTVLEVDNDDEALAKIHYYTGIEMSDVVVKWVPVSQLIPMIGAGPNYIAPSGYEEWPPVEGGHFNDGMW
jgi:hypothetical protein